MKYAFGVLSSIFMIIAGNIPKWLPDLLKSKGAPEWIYNDFTLYFAIFGLFAWANTKLSDFLLASDDLKNLKKNQRKKISELKSNHTTQITQKNDEIRDLKQRLKSKTAAFKKMSGDYAKLIEENYDLQFSRSDYESPAESVGRRNDFTYGED